MIVGKKIDALVDETNIWQDEIDPLISELDSIEEDDYNLLHEIKSFQQQVEIAQSELADIDGDNVCS